MNDILTPVNLAGESDQELQTRAEEILKDHDLAYTVVVTWLKRNGYGAEYWRRYEELIRLRANLEKVES